MIDSLPLECFEQVVKRLSQEDKISLTYVSRESYHRTVAHLYRNLYLNNKPEFKSDLDTHQAHHWSLLHIPWQSSHEEAAKSKLQLLLRSFESNTKLCNHIIQIRCAWHTHVPTLIKIIYLLGKYASKLRYFSGFLDQDVMCVLSVLAPRLSSLVIAPWTKVPEGKAPAEYYEKVTSLVYHYDWSKITSLTLYADAFSVIPSVTKPLKIRRLCLNLRPDTFNERPLHRYSTIFDINSLQELFIVSWYKANDQEADLYEEWRLYDFYEYHNLRMLTITSLRANQEYVRRCCESSPHLKILTVDFLFDAPVDSLTIKCMRDAQCSKTLECLDVRFEPLSAPLLSIDEAGERFVPKLTCQCNDCRETFNEVVRKVFFPNSEKLRIRGFNDINSRNFTLQMFKLMPILPHPLIMGNSPAIAYINRSLEDHADKMNELLRNDQSHSPTLTSSDVRKLYHAHVHSMKKTFDHFLQCFPNLHYLTLNDIPTQVKQFDEQQRCNIPVFYSQGYRSNQAYELVSDESLFE